MSKATALRMAFLFCYILLVSGSYHQVVTADDNSSRIRALYSEAITLFQQQKYEDAAKAFRALVAISPRYQYFFDIGECEYLRGRLDLAVEAFDVFLDNSGEKVDEDSRRFIEKVKQDAEGQTGWIAFEIESSFQVWVDEEYRCDTPVQAPLAVMSGRHTVVLKKDGESVYSTVITVKTGETAQAEFKDSKPEQVLDDSPDSQPSQPNERTSTSEPLSSETIDVSFAETKSPLEVVGIVTAGMGVSVLVAGGITGGMAISRSNQLDENCDNRNACDERNKSIKTSGEKLEAATNGLLVTGAVLTATGAILAIAGHRRRVSDEVVRIVPLIDRTLAGITVQGSF